MRKARKERFARKKLYGKRSEDVYMWYTVTIDGYPFTVYTAKPKFKGRCYRIPLGFAIRRRKSDIRCADIRRTWVAEMELPF